MGEVSEVLSRSSLGSPYMTVRIFSQSVVFLTNACLTSFLSFLKEALDRRHVSPRDKIRAVGRASDAVHPFCYGLTASGQSHRRAILSSQKLTSDSIALSQH